jgi:hypothetical protein
MNLVSAQADITAAFVHAPLGPNEHIHVRQPAGFQRDGDFVLKLKKSVYGLCQSSWNFIHYLSKHLVAQDLTPSAFDPCLFIGKSVIIMVYIDYLLIYAKSDMEITALISASRLLAFASAVKGPLKVSLVSTSCALLMQTVPKSPSSRLALTNPSLKPWVFVTASQCLLAPQPKLLLFPRMPTANRHQIRSTILLLSAYCFTSAATPDPTLPLLSISAPITHSTLPVELNWCSSGLDVT